MVEYNQEASSPLIVVVCVIEVLKLTVAGVARLAPATGIPFGLADVQFAFENVISICADNFLSQRIQLFILLLVERRPTSRAGFTQELGDHILSHRIVFLGLLAGERYHGGRRLIVRHLHHHLFCSCWL